MIPSSSCPPWPLDTHPAKTAGDQDGTAALTPLPGTRSCQGASNAVHGGPILGRIVSPLRLLTNVVPHRGYIHTPCTSSIGRRRETLPAWRFPPVCRSGPVWRSADRSRKCRAVVQTLRVTGRQD